MDRLLKFPAAHDSARYLEDLDSAPTRRALGMADDDNSLSVIAAQLRRYSTLSAQIHNAITDFND